MDACFLACILRRLGHDMVKFPGSTTPLRRTASLFAWSYSYCLDYFAHAPYSKYEYSSSRESQPLRQCCPLPGSQDVVCYAVPCLYSHLIILLSADVTRASRSAYMARHALPGECHVISCSRTKYEVINPPRPRPAWFIPCLLALVVLLPKWVWCLVMQTFGSRCSRFSMQ